MSRLSLAINSARRAAEEAKRVQQEQRLSEEQKQKTEFERGRQWIAQEVVPAFDQANTELGETGHALWYRENFSGVHPLIHFAFCKRQSRKFPAPKDPNALRVREGQAFLHTQGNSGKMIGEIATLDRAAIDSVLEGLASEYGKAIGLEH